MTFDRITAKPDQMGGTPCIRGLRIPLATVVGLVAQGMTTEQILDEYPDLEPEDIQQTAKVIGILSKMMLSTKRSTLRAHARI